MDEADRCDRVALIQRGRLLAVDTPDAIARVVRSAAARHPRRRQLPTRYARSATTQHARRCYRSARAMHYTDATRRRAGRSIAARARRVPRVAAAFATRRSRRCRRPSKTCSWRAWAADEAAAREPTRSRDRGERSHAPVRRLRRRRPHHVRRARRRGLRLPRRERRRQDDGDPDADRAAGADRRHRRRSPVSTSTPRARSSSGSIGYMSQRFSLYEDLTVRENIQLYGGIYDLTTAQIRERTDAHAGAARPDGAARRARPRRFRSAGGRSSRSRSRSLHQPRIVFLDEPTSGVDPITRRQFWELIYEAAAPRHDRVRHDPLHGRGGVLRSHLDHGRRPHRRDRHAGRAEAAVRRRVDRRRVRDAGAAGGRSGRRTGQPRSMKRARRPAAEGGVPHPARSADADVIIAAADRAGDHLRLRDPHRRRPRAPGHRRSGARRRHARAAQPVRGDRRVPRRRRRCRPRATSSRCSGEGGAGGRGVRAGLRRAASAAALPAQVLIVTDATEPNTGSVVQAYALPVIQGYERERGAARERRSRDRAVGPHALQPDARELEPVRPRPDGLRADHHLVADDGHLAHAREGDRHDGSAARVAAAAVANHRRQGRALPRHRLRQRARRDRRGAPGVRRAAARQPRCCCSPKGCSSSWCRCRSAS